jgi:quinol monooxygenase YgiN
MFILRSCAKLLLSSRSGKRPQVCQNYDWTKSGRGLRRFPLFVGAKEKVMVKVGLLVQLQAKAGKEAVVAKFLADALALANQEAGTLVWFALQTGPSTFAIFDAFADDAGRKAHLAGPIAAALMANASELLSQPPQIGQVDVLAAKVPK